MNKQYDLKKNKFLKDFKTLLSFPTIGADPKQKNAMHECADYLKNRLFDLGFKATLLETTSHPVLFGEYKCSDLSKPTLLLYNHYDVQPIDPLELWDTPPFTPTVKDNAIYARGAQDNKGQLQYVLQALELFGGQFPINIKILIEGDEETGSAGLKSILSKEKERLKSDYLAIVDVGMKSKELPAVTLGVRGIATLDVTLKGPKQDMHSGSHGGVIKNPLQSLCVLIAKCYTNDGSVAIPHFYDTIEPITAAEKDLLDLSFNETHYQKMAGTAPIGGENKRPALERAWLRPTLEINGLYGGYSGEGFKTIIPSTAHAKISMRLVKGQEPETMLSLVKDFLTKECPDGIQIDINLHKGGGRACMTKASSSFAKAAKAAFEKVFKTSCAFIMEGGSIPVSVDLSEASQSIPLFFGLGLDEDNIHAPNEHFSLDRLQKGTFVIMELIKNLGE